MRIVCYLDPENPPKSPLKRGTFKAPFLRGLGDFHQCWYKPIDLVRISKHPLSLFMHSQDHLCYALTRFFNRAADSKREIDFNVVQ